jgi:hypothetical protein
MVFGFFLDGQEQQVPVIMGVLGNNAQTVLSTKIGTSKTNFTATSGYAKGKDPDPNIKVPASGQPTEKPGSKPASPKSGYVMYREKTVLLNPCDMVGSAMKAIQTVIDNLTKKIDSVLQAAQSYVDAASTLIK